MKKKNIPWTFINPSINRSPPDVTAAFANGKGVRLLTAAEATGVDKYIDEFFYGEDPLYWGDLYAPKSPTPHNVVVAYSLVDDDK